MSDTNRVEIENISKEMGSFRLNNIELAAESKDIVGIIGENGAGKTTLLKILSKVISFDSGTLSVPLKKDIGFVFDSNHFPDDLSAKELNYIMPYVFRKWDASKYLNYLKRFELPEKLSIKKYSKGMKTKIGIAVALSHSPKFLLLDEITSGLDPLIRDDMLNVIREYVNNNAAIGIMTTHMLDDVMKIANKVLALDNGTVVLNQNVSEIGDAQDLENNLKQIIVRK